MNSEALVFRNMFDHRLAIWSENILALLLNCCEARLLSIWFTDVFFNYFGNLFTLGNMVKATEDKREERQS